MILRRCSGCESNYRLSRRLAGKKVRCKACGETFDVPLVDDPQDDVAEVVLDADDGDSEPPKPKKGKSSKAAGGSRASCSSLPRHCFWLSRSLGEVSLLITCF